MSRPELGTDEFIADALRRGFLRADLDTGEVFGRRHPLRPLGYYYRGYLRSCLVVSGSKRDFQIHRVVWIAGNGVPAPGMCVCHRNNKKDDNRLSNLYLATAEDNSRHARRDGLYPVGERSATSKISDAERLELTRAYTAGEGSYEALGSRLGITGSHASQIVRGRAWNPGLPEADDLAYLDQLASDLDADRLDAADRHWSGLLMTDEEQDERDRLEFLERTAGLDASDVYPVSRRQEEGDA